MNLKSLIALAGTLCVLGLLPAQAEDNNTNIISGTSVNNAAADYFAGNTGTNNYLQIDSGGQLSNVKDAYVGNAATASANAALVTGASSLLGANNRVYVGNSGKSNSLTVANGASVVATAQVLFGFNAGSDGNLPENVTAPHHDGSNLAKNRQLLPPCQGVGHGASPGETTFGLGTASAVALSTVTIAATSGRLATESICASGDALKAAITAMAEAAIAHTAVVIS